MPRFLLDTNICIYITKQQPPEVLARFKRLAPGDVAMSVVTWGELAFGAEKSRESARARDALSKLADLIPVLPMDARVGEQYGKIRAALEYIGRPIGNNDLWIAAHALAEGIVLVTNNEAEFSRVPALRVVNWTSSGVRRGPGG